MVYKLFAKKLFRKIFSFLYPQKSLLQKQMFHQASSLNFDFLYDLHLTISLFCEAILDKTII